MNKTFFIVLLLISPVIASYPQSVIPPSPNASALLEHANIPVDLYTGIPGVEVPIFTLQGRRIEVPISISYHASGIKVDDIASSVGLGWTLNAGGMITRMMRDEPDESDYGYCGSIERVGDVINDPDFVEYLEIAESYDYWDTYKELLEEVRDTEPDIFFFNFMGKQGKFVLSPSGDPIILPFQDITIKPAIGPKGQGKWTIIDEEGTQYIFGNGDPNNTEFVETSIASRGKREYDKDDPIERFNPELNNTYKYKKDKDDPDREFVSTWYLAEIKDRNGISLAWFSYDEGEEIVYDTYTERITRKLSSAGDNSNTDSDTENSNTEFRSRTRIIDPSYPKKVITDLGEIEFMYDSDGRLDLPNGKRLKTVKITNKKNGVLSEKIGTFSFEYLTKSTGVSPESKRIYLDRVLQETTGTGDIIFRSFEYYTERNLPYRGHPDIDSWGYYNYQPESEGGNGIVGTTRITFTEIDGTRYGGTNNKKPHFESTRAGSLKKMIYPTGGHEQFEYELHRVTGEDRGGLRIKKITSHDGISVDNDIIQHYYYTDVNGQSSGTALVPPLHITEEFVWTSEFLIINSESLVDLYDLDGNHIGYEEVTITQEGGGKIVYQYSNFDTHPDEKPILKAASFSVIGGPVPIPIPTFVNYTHSNLSEVAVNTSRFWQRGLLKSIATYNDLGTLLQYERHSYETQGLKRVIGGVTFVSEISVSNEPLIDMARYEMISEAYVLDRSETFAFDQGSPGLALVSATEYEYDPDHLQITETRTENSKGETLINKIKYLKDYVITTDASQELSSEVEAMKKLKNRNVNIPIEQIQFIKRPDSSTPSAIAGSLITFKVFNKDQVYPYQNFELETDTPIDNLSFSTTLLGSLARDVNYRGRLINTFENYNTDGNLMQETGSDGIKRQYTWSHNNSLLESVTVGPDRFNSQTTRYVYKPLVGLTKEIDPNGRVIEYRYDEFNRLKLVINNEGNILNKYAYKVVKEVEP